MGVVAEEGGFRISGQPELLSSKFKPGLHSETDSKKKTKKTDKRKFSNECTMSMTSKYLGQWWQGCNTSIAFQRTVHS
jgi:hypothetical protein